MESLISVVLASGRAGVDMALYILLPIMVVMLALMKLMDAKGLFTTLSNLLAPLTRVFGVPGLGVLAMIKVLFVSFAGPIATLTVMEQRKVCRRAVAATLAMILTMSQANASFPLSAMGLDLGFTIFTSVVGGLAAAAFTFYVLTRHIKEDLSAETLLREENAENNPKGVFQLLSAGGQEGVKMTLGMLPMLILAILLVNILKEVGAIELLTGTLSPILMLIGLPESTVLPLVTKFIAGGTAFVGVTIDLMKQGVISVEELNRMAFVTNPLDLAGIAIFSVIGARIASVVRYAVYGAIFGMIVRAGIHLLVY